MTETSVSDANVLFETMKEDVVINRAECSREDEKDKEGGGAGIRSPQQVIWDSVESCLGAVGWTETRMELFI